jgi:hypothetical protein
MNIGWIDFSKEQRNKVLSVINLLSEPGAVDELGIGTIRDYFSNIFFPGTSTIQTRAKYFLLTSYLLNELEREKGMTPDKMIHRLHEQELSFIDVLKQSGQTGIIGETAGMKLKRKPSDVYWNGIRTFGLFTGGKMSIHDYARVTCHIKANKQNIKSQGTKDDEKDADDRDAVMGDLIGNFWKLPIVPTNWREHLSIDLTKQESEYLRKQIISAVPNSMIGYMLEKNYTDIIRIDSFDNLEGMINVLPDQMKSDYFMAKEFADFVYGIFIRYNIILSQEKDDDAIAKWERWGSEIAKYGNIDLHNILFNRLQINNGKLITFLLDCKDAMIRNDIKKLDELVIAREIRLKGNKRSKLNNASEFKYKEWVGIGKLQYRLRNAQNIMEDIFEGLGIDNVQTDN